MKTTKEFLLSVPKDALFEKYYKEYYIDDEIFIAAAKKANVDSRDIAEKNFQKIMKCIERLPVRSNPEEFICPFVSYDYDINPDLTYKISRSVTASIIKPFDISVREKMRPISSFDELKMKNSDFYFETYSFIFSDWEEVLGLNIVYEPDTRADIIEVAAFLIHEISFMGLDSEEAKNNSAKELKILDERSKDAEAISVKDLADVPSISFLDLPKISPEEEKLQEELMELVLVKSINEKIRVFNEYILPILKKEAV